MPNFPAAIQSRLPAVGTTIFTVMSRLAQQHGALNLSQGFPDFSAPQALFGLFFNGWPLAIIIVTLTLTAWITVVQRVAYVYNATTRADVADARTETEGSPGALPADARRALV